MVEMEVLMKSGVAMGIGDLGSDRGFRGRGGPCLRQLDGGGLVLCLPTFVANRCSLGLVTGQLSLPLQPSVPRLAQYCPYPS